MKDAGNSFCCFQPWVEAWTSNWTMGSDHQLPTQSKTNSGKALRPKRTVSIILSSGLFNPSVCGQDWQAGEEGRGWSASSGLPGTSPDGSIFESHFSIHPTWALAWELSPQIWWTCFFSVPCSSPHDWLQIFQMGRLCAMSHPNPANQQIDLGCQEWQRLPAFARHTSHRNVITLPVLREPLRWLMNWETENWFGWVERVGYEAGVTMVFFVVVLSIQKELLMLKKPLTLISSFMCPACFRHALRCCGNWIL